CSWLMLSVASLGAEDCGRIAGLLTKPVFSFRQDIPGRNMLHRVPYQLFSLHYYDIVFFDSFIG
ncbi:MAG: hypothetical protein IKD68_05470, partial [Solobacterium sp.]|nr:hypothetical protein [Solobacterium sp.]